MKKLVLHPYLFGLYTILFLISVNLKRIPLSASYRVLTYHFVVISLLLLLLKVVTRSWYRAGVVCSLAVLLFNSYGHVYAYFAGKQFWGKFLGRADILAAIWAAAFILVGWWVIRVMSRPEIVSGYLNIFSILLVIIPLIQITWFHSQQIYYSNLKANRTQSAPQPVDQKVNRPPDIYYVVLDEYGRQDVLKEVISYDNSELIQYLRGKGFYVADDSHANYPITQFSLQSSLNLDYLDGDEKANVYSAVSLIHHNQVRRFLESQGYQTITFATDYAQTDISDSDYYFKPDSYINSFEFMYFLSSFLVHYIDNFYFPQSRALITNAFERLKEVPEINPETPKLVFAHIPAAHVPYVFGPEGELDNPWTLPVGKVDPDVARQGYIHAYSGQVAYVNKRLAETIDAILSKSEIEPIIIIQSDHGPQAYYNYAFDSVCIKERLAIINAYYLPGFDEKKLYPTISPVNTFRLIFDNYFDTNYGLLEDRSYLTLRDDLSLIVDATSRWDDCRIH
jgi:hypothetical protein